MAERARLRAEKAGNEEQRKLDLRAAAKLRSVRSGANARGLSCELTKADMAALLAQKLCARTGISFEPEGDFALSVDRVDNARGYETGNVEAVCWIYNRAKGATTSENVLRMARALAAMNP